MQVKDILHEVIGRPLEKANIRLTQISAIMDMTASLLNTSHLTLTSLGRHMDGDAYVKHKIKRVDRWLGNAGLYSQLFHIYQAIFSSLLLKRKELKILVDWSGCCNWTECCIRASLVYEGRSITIYQEIHPSAEHQKPYVHKAFLNHLSSLIPKNMRVIIITDRGFQLPWFTAVKELGWDFIGRISNSHHYQLDNNEWKPINELYRGATSKPQYIGDGVIGKSSKNKLHISFYRYKEKSKKRTFKKVRNKPSYPHLNEFYSKINNTPWVIVTSLSGGKAEATRMILDYKYRMQIEQNFRDDKNERWGFGFQYNRSKSKFRIAILLLIAAIASYVMMLIGVIAENHNLHKKFQANTRNQRVLSFLSLAKQILRHESEMLDIQKLRHSFCIIAEGPSYEMAN